MWVVLPPSCSLKQSVNGSRRPMAKILEHSLSASSGSSCCCCKNSFSSRVRPDPQVIKTRLMLLVTCYSLSFLFWMLQTLKLVISHNPLVLALIFRILMPDRPWWSQSVSFKCFLTKRWQLLNPIKITCQQKFLLHALPASSHSAHKPMEVSKAHNRVIIDLV